MQVTSLPPVSHKSNVWRWHVAASAFPNPVLGGVLWLASGQFNRDPCKSGGDELFARGGSNVGQRV